MNAARHNEERPHEDDEGHVVREEHVDDGIDARRKVDQKAERHCAAERPEESDLAEIRVPEMRQEKRHERNRKQNACKRNGPAEPESAAVKGSGARRQGGGKKGERCERTGGEERRHKELPALCFVFVAGLREKTAPWMGVRKRRPVEGHCRNM